MRPIVALLAVLLGGCGTAAAPPTAPSPAPTPEPPPTSFHAVTGIVFHDEDDSGAVDGGENVRLGGVAVTLGGRTATSNDDGEFIVPDVPGGTRSPEIAASTLPPFFRPGRLASVPVPPPDGFVLALPVVLPIGGNRPHVYMAFGDSLTTGDGSRGGRGYRGPLQSLLRGRWGRAEVVDEGIPATRTADGVERLGASLAAVRPAYTLVVYGTNDWNMSSCRSAGELCPTLPNLRAMIRQVKAAGSLPVVATIVPANPSVPGRMAEDRNLWIDEVNAFLRPIVHEEGAALADVNAAFRRETSNLPALFTDHVHPNDRGYAVMAEELFRAITAPIGAQGAAAGAGVQRPRRVGRRSARASSAR